jgi:hypothetical protein
MDAAITVVGDFALKNTGGGEKFSTFLKIAIAIAIVIGLHGGQRVTAGVAGPSPHDCRHYWATNAARNGRLVFRAIDLSIAFSI